MLYKQISKDERKLIDYLYNFQKRIISFIAKEMKRVNQVSVEKLKEIPS